jgi:hypothetical protein
MVFLWRMSADTKKIFVIENHFSIQKPFFNTKNGFLYYKMVFFFLYYKMVFIGRMSAGTKKIFVLKNPFFTLKNGFGCPKAKYRLCRKSRGLRKAYRGKKPPPRFSTQKIFQYKILKKGVGSCVQV